MSFEEKVLNKIRSINWNEYSGPENFEYSKVIKAFERILNLRDENERINVYNEVLFAIGNNHAGTYYPIVLKILPILLETSTKTPFEIIQNCVFEIITDLYCSFDSEIGGYSNKTNEEIERWLKRNIEYFVMKNNQIMSERNQILINELIDVIEE